MTTRDYVWQQIELHGERTIRRRIAEIDSASLNADSYIPFYPPWRNFLQKYLDAPLDSTPRFFEWREYLYLLPTPEGPVPALPLLPDSSAGDKLRRSAFRAQQAAGRGNVQTPG